MRGDTAAKLFTVTLESLRQRRRISDSPEMVFRRAFLLSTFHSEQFEIVNVITNEELANANAG